MRWRRGGFLAGVAAEGVEERGLALAGLRKLIPVATPVAIQLFR